MPKDIAEAYVEAFTRPRAEARAEARATKRGEDIAKARAEARAKLYEEPKVLLSLGTSDRAQALRIRDERLLEVGEVLSWVCLGEELVGSPIAIPQFDQFDGFDRVFAFPEDLPSLGRFWSEMTGAREVWSRNALDAAPCKVPKGPKALS